MWYNGFMARVAGLTALPALSEAPSIAGIGLASFVAVSLCRTAVPDVMGTLCPVASGRRSGMRQPKRP